MVGMERVATDIITRYAFDMRPSSIGTIFGSRVTVMESGDAFAHKLHWPLSKLYLPFVPKVAFEDKMMDRDGHLWGAQGITRPVSWSQIKTEPLKTISNGFHLKEDGTVYRGDEVMYTDVIALSADSYLVHAVVNKHSSFDNVVVSRRGNLTIDKKGTVRRHRYLNGSPFAGVAEFEGARKIGSLNRADFILRGTTLIEVGDERTSYQESVTDILCDTDTVIKVFNDGTLEMNGKIIFQLPHVSSPLTISIEESMHS